MTGKRASEFETILAQVEADMGSPAPGEDAGASGPLVGEAIRHFREALGQADNMGGSGDARDVYVLLDEMVRAVRASYPGVRCAAGCSGCCDSETAVFDVDDEEWSRIEAHVLTRWSPERRAAFRERFEREHGPRLRAYRLLAAVRHFEPIADRYWARKPYRCPFLEDGRCAIYEARPLACRMYGYFAMRARWYEAPSIYACRMQADYFTEVRDGGALYLPSVNAVAARVKRLARKRPRGRRPRILPLWIAASWPT